MRARVADVEVRRYFEQFVDMAPSRTRHDSTASRARSDHSEIAVVHSARPVHVNRKEAYRCYLRTARALLAPVERVARNVETRRHPFDRAPLSLSW